MIAEQRHALMDTEQWQLHERLLRMFPADTVAEYPDLTLMTAWMARLGWLDSAQMLALVDKAEGLAAQMPDQAGLAVHFKGEIDTLSVIVACEAASDPENVIALARQALATTPRAWYYLRSTAWLYLSVAYQMAGRLDQAYAALAEGQPEDVAESGAVRARVAGSRCFVEWMAGDLQAIPQGRPICLLWARRISASYQRNDLTAAEAHVRAVEGMRYLGRPMIYLRRACLPGCAKQTSARAIRAKFCRHSASP